MNPIGLNGIEFIEFASPDPSRLHRLFKEFGFSRTQIHPSRSVDLYEQGEIRFLLQRGFEGAAADFADRHGPSISAMGWRVADPKRALEIAVSRGARPARFVDYWDLSGEPIPAIEGIGGSCIYFVRDWDPEVYAKLGFQRLERPEWVAPKGFTAIDHLTHNVEFGTMKQWSDFYRDIFGFTDVRYFDIRGVETGLQSNALRSPCGSFCIPINEAKEQHSQINEYLEEYRGPGIQHLAFLTDDILGSLRALEGTGVETLDIDDAYYDEVFERVPGVEEDHDELRRRQVLVDGDEKGYLLQIFTRNLIGPIFIEIIQRKNHLSFGEGNFSALFRSIERDQAKRGVFSTDQAVS